MSEIIFLSHCLNETTPSYGNRHKLHLEKIRSMFCGDHANESFLHMSVHLGTHIDMPLHFHIHGQSIEDYSASFWIFDHPLIVEIQPQGQVICQEIVSALNKFSAATNKTCDLLIVKTGVGAIRSLPEFFEKNPGFSPDLYTYFKSEMPLLRVFGFDGISLTGFQNKDVGKAAHQRFLNPDAPILILEDMKLDEVFSETQLEKIIILPLRIAKSDGLPCTVIGLLGRGKHG